MIFKAPESLIPAYFTTLKEYFSNESSQDYCEFRYFFLNPFKINKKAPQTWEAF